MEVHSLQCVSKTQHTRQIRCCFVSSASDSADRLLNALLFASLNKSSTSWGVIRRVCWYIKHFICKSGSQRPQKGFLGGVYVWAVKIKQTCYHKLSIINLHLLIRAFQIITHNCQGEENGKRQFFSLSLSLL